MALEVLNSYMRTLPHDRARPTYDESEMVMLKALFTEKSGKLEECLNILNESKDDIVDVIARDEKQGELLLRLGRWDAAETAYKNMIDINPDNYLYHRGLQVSLSRFFMFITHVSPADLSATTCRRPMLVALWDGIKAPKLPLSREKETRERIHERRRKGAMWHRSYNKKRA